MSQIFKSSADGPTPPVVATSYVTNNGTAVPAANILNVLGSGGAVTSGSGNTITVSLQNGQIDQIQTIDNTTATLVTIPLGIVPRTYTFDVRIAALSISGTASGLGGGFQIFTSVRTDGLVGTVIDISDIVSRVDQPALNQIGAAVSISGNNMIVQVTGQTGNTINWGSFSVYVYI